MTTEKHALEVPSGRSDFRRVRIAWTAAGPRTSWEADKSHLAGNTAREATAPVC